MGSALLLMTCPYVLLNTAALVLDRYRAALELFLHDLSLHLLAQIVELDLTAVLCNVLSSLLEVCPKYVS